MKLDKTRCIRKENSTLICIDNIDTNETLMLDEEYIFIENIKTTQDIVITRKTIILGDIECNFLNALGEVICYGNIKANTIYTNKDIECFKDIAYNSLLGGNINKKSTQEDIKEIEVIKEVEVVKEIEKIKEVEIEVNPLEDIRIDNDTLPDQLTLIDDFKEKIMNYIDSELVFLDENILVEDLEQIGLTFIEFKKYSELLSKILEYSETIQIKTLNDYIEFLNIIKYIPTWLEEIDIVQEIINKHKIVDEDELLEMDINIDTQNEFVDLVGHINNCKDLLAEAYEYVSYHVITKYYKIIKEGLNLEIELEKKSKDDIANIIKEAAKELDDKTNLEELYDKYIWDKGLLIEGKVIDVDNEHIYMTPNNEERNKHVSIKMKKHFINRYKPDDILYGHISEVEMKDNCIEVTISNESENMPRLLFNKLREKYGLNKCTIQKYKRIKGKSTCIVIVVFDGKDYEEEIDNISREMKKYLNGEHVGIFIYDKSVEKFASNILGIDELDIKIDKVSRKCIAVVDKADEFRIRDLLEKQESNMKNIYEYEIEIKNKPSISTQNIKINNEVNIDVKTTDIVTPEYTNSEIYTNILKEKGNIISGKITSISSKKIQVDIGYDAESIIKYFNKDILHTYKVGDYIEARINNLSKKEDGSVRVILSRDDVDFVKACLKEVRNNLGYKHITFKTAKKLPNEKEYVASANIGDINIVDIEKQLLDIKIKVEDKLHNEIVNIYQYSKDVVQQIRNITKIKLKEININRKISVCNINCEKEEYELVKSKKEVIEALTAYKTLNIIEPKVKDSATSRTISIIGSSNYSESYFSNVFTRIKNELNIKYYNIKKCSYSDVYGALLVIENKSKSSTHEEITFIESLMNKECKQDIVKIVEFKYDASSFLSDLFDVEVRDIQQVPGKFYINNLDESKMGKYNFIRDEVLKIVNYKIEI
ncbi:hypothetical protein [Romboutsia lituseburensis]|uniref:hypothetical protein n=1 Tax=Romboutsia lituseburensis TaxID=1537 RepID=UPI00215B36A8|nr:hypothetical protein [Romboutsia lituseburensis]MCR8743912.1 hypothetical protein [Romboutsia lituseburensis]